MAIDFSRRDFLKKTGLVAGGVGLSAALPAAIKRAMTINPDKGTTFENAEHIVLLMQENRSFDHCFGSLRGVRGFNDPHPLRLPNGNPVWLQTDAKNDTYKPFRFDIQNTKIAWMGGLPHTWRDQVDARNGGKYDKWLIAKKTGYPGFEGKPMTLGFYNREDIPFNYALADAFTVCDQHFCSSLTGTTPNRLYFFSGTLRKDGKAENPSLVRNEEADYSAEVDWKTVPEMLQENGISWRVYQNELSLSNDMPGQNDAWLGNFTDNDLEWFSQFHVRRSEKYKAYLESRLQKYDESIAKLEEKAIQNPDDEKTKKGLNNIKSRKKNVLDEYDRCQMELALVLSADQQALHDNAFVTNDFDPDYHNTEELEYEDRGTKRKMSVPKSDVLANFRRDVNGGKLPAVSWLVAPQYFSDHPSAPFFGAWYISEVMDILTSNPEVWKKTIFILTYDENDGYFDHVPPFVAPDYRHSETGTVSAGIKNLDKEFVTMKDELEQKMISPQNARESAIGLGYRVPFIVASPWSRGGFVNSQVFDHTSVVQFIEKFASRKTGKDVRLENISEWRRAVCGDLSSCFRPYEGGNMAEPTFLNRNAYIQRIYESRYLNMPQDVNPLSSKEIEDIQKNTFSTKTFFQQEKGTKPSNALPYELYADGQIDIAMASFALHLRAGNSIFKNKSQGAAFTLYAYHSTKGEKNKNWSFAVLAGEELHYKIALNDLDSKAYHFVLFGPNGFYREWKGDLSIAPFSVESQYELSRLKKEPELVLTITNLLDQKQSIQIHDLQYGQAKIDRELAAKQKQIVHLSLRKSMGWYALALQSKDNSSFEIEYGGRIENGKITTTDPAMA